MAVVRDPRIVAQRPQRYEFLGVKAQSLSKTFQTKHGNNPGRTASSRAFRTECMSDGNPAP
jgi:hypothetical protein